MFPRDDVRLAGSRLAHAFVLAVRGYQLLVRPLFPPACRFVPSCSEFAIEAVRSHGVRHGLPVALRRIGRCHPWHPGGYDPVPPGKA